MKRDLNLPTHAAIIISCIIKPMAVCVPTDRLALWAEAPSSSRNDPHLECTQRHGTNLWTCSLLWTDRDRRRYTVFYHEAVVFWNRQPLWLPGPIWRPAVCWSVGGRKAHCRSQLYSQSWHQRNIPNKKAPGMSIKQGMLLYCYILAHKINLLMRG